VGFNEVVNRGCQLLLGSADVEELKLRAKLVALRREEADLRQSMRVMLRSGSFLPKYAKELFREPGRSVSFVRDGQVPLKALSPREEDIARRVLAERERLAAEIAEVLDKLLPEKKFRLKPEPARSRSRARDRTKPFGKGGA